MAAEGVRHGAANERGSRVCSACGGSGRRDEQADCAPALEGLQIGELEPGNDDDAEGLGAGRACEVRRG